MHERDKPVQEKRHRLPRSYYVGEVIVSMTACMAGRRPAFSNRQIVDECRSLLAEAATAQSCAVPIYCFMPDHVHLMLQGLRPDSDVWKAMVQFKQRTGYWFSKQGVGQRWQKDFHDHVLKPKEDWRALVRYIAGNPVRAGLAEQWDQYPFTGAIGHDLMAVIDQTR